MMSLHCHTVQCFDPPVPGLFVTSAIVLGAVACERLLPCRVKGLFLTSIVLGAVACGSSLLLLWAALDSGTPGSLFAQLGLPPMPYGKITTMVYLKVRAGSGLRHPGQPVCSAGPAPHSLRQDHDHGVPQGEGGVWTQTRTPGGLNFVSLPPMGCPMVRSPPWPLTVR